MTVGLFEAHDTFGLAIAEIVKPLLDEFQLTKKKLLGSRMRVLI